MYPMTAPPESAPRDCARAANPRGDLRERVPCAIGERFPSKDSAAVRPAVNLTLGCVDQRHPPTGA
jgi:hypothetical protein